MFASTISDTTPPKHSQQPHEHVSNSAFSQPTPATPQSSHRLKSDHLSQISASAPPPAKIPVYFAEALRQIPKASADKRSFTYVMCHWECVHNIPQAVPFNSADRASNEFEQSLRTDPQTAKHLFLQALSQSSFIKYQSIFSDWLQDLDLNQPAERDSLNPALQQSIQKRIHYFQQNPLPIDPPRDGHSYQKIVLGATPHPQDPEIVVSLNYIHFYGDWTPVHNHPERMADGIIKGTMREAHLIPTIDNAMDADGSKGTDESSSTSHLFAISAINLFNQGETLFDYDRNLRWHMTRPEPKGSELTILNGYVGPGYQHVVAAYPEPYQQLIANADSVDHPLQNASPFTVDKSA
jgi:hypothetical protein